MAMGPLQAREDPTPALTHFPSCAILQAWANSRFRCPCGLDGIDYVRTPLNGGIIGT